MLPMLPILVALCGVLAPTAAEFTVSFAGGLQYGANVLLEWEPVEATYSPLVLFAQVFNKTEKSVTSMAQNISVDLTAASTLWTNVPSPLPYYPTASYVLQLLPQNWNVITQGQMPVLAMSDMFSVVVQGADGKTNSTNSNPSSPSATSPIYQGAGGVEEDSDADRRRTLGLALGLAIGIPSFIAACVVGSIWQKRLRAAKEEKRRQRRFGTIIS